MPPLVDELHPEVNRALLAHGFMPAKVCLLSPLGTAKGRRLAYRVEDGEGRVLKVRHFENPDIAERIFGLRDNLEEAFAPAIARYGAVIMEEWIEGVPLAGRETPERQAEAGALLGRLHARPLGRHEPATTSTQPWLDGARSDLDELQSADVLAPAIASALKTALERHDPETARTALVHMDFCASNMLIDPRGRLRIIDNELFLIAPPGLDLGRTFHHWPMSAEAWVDFLRGYRSSAPHEPEAFPFWRLVAAALGARIFLRCRSPAMTASLARLHQCIEGDPHDDFTG